MCLLIQLVQRSKLSFFLTSAVLLSACSAEEMQEYLDGLDPSPTATLEPTPEPTPGSDSGQPLPTAPPVGEPTLAPSDVPSTPTPVSSPTPEVSMSLVAFKTATASENDGHEPTSAIDGDMTGESRWSAYGESPWLELGFDGMTEICGVAVSFFRGDERSARFSLEASRDGSEWKSVLAQSESSGSDAGLEYFVFGDREVVSLKFIGHGNSADLWNSVVEIYGVQNCSDENAITPVPTLVPTSVVTPIPEPSTEPTPAQPQPTNVPEPTAIPTVLPSATSTPKPTAAPSPEPTGANDPNLDASKPPSENFDLKVWKLTLPVSKTHYYGGGGSSAAEVLPSDDAVWPLDDGFEDSEYFYTGDDGEMVFRTPLTGGSSTTNSSYVRTELRELYEWVEGKSSGSANWDNEGKHVLKARLKVSDYWAEDPQTVVGQIHAKDSTKALLKLQWDGPDKPVRAIINEDPDKGSPFSLKFDVVGMEEFEYTITLEENTLTITVGDVTHSVTFGEGDMSMKWDDHVYYFKAGNYAQADKSGGGVFSVKFYSLDVQH